MRNNAIRNIYSNVVSINNETDAWDSEGNVVVLDEGKVTTEMARLQAEYNAQEYARARQPLYPAIGDQLDDLYHAGVFSAEMTATLKKVKDDNPK
jgi:hypothetical protein